MLLTADTVDTLYGILSEIRGHIEGTRITIGEIERLKEVALYLSCIVIGTPSKPRTIAEADQMRTIEGTD